MITCTEPMNNNFSCLFEKFAKICPEKGVNSFKSMRNILEDPVTTIQKPWDIYPVYANAMTVAKELGSSQNPKLKQRFITILKAFHDRTVPGQGTSNIKFDFTPIIEMINQNKTELSCRPEIVDFQNDLKVQEAAVALDSLMQEGTGLSFGVNFISKRIKSTDGWCCVARDEQNRIIASVLGTNLHILEKNSTVFHFNILVRSPKYPFINFTYMLQKFEIDLIKKFNPDYLSLCVDLDNPAAKLYEKIGFVKISVQYNQTLKRDAIFMVKNFNNKDKEMPALAHVRSALDLINQKENI